MIARTIAAAHRMSHWTTPKRIRDSAPAIGRSMLPAITPPDELAGISLAPTVACCKGAQPKGALAKSVIARLKRGFADQAISAASGTSASFKEHSIKAPSIVNAEKGESGVTTRNAAKNCASPGLLRKNRICPADSVSRDSQTM